MQNVKDIPKLRIFKCHPSLPGSDQETPGLPASFSNLADKSFTLAKLTSYGQYIWYHLKQVGFKVNSCSKK